MMKNLIWRDGELIEVVETGEELLDTYTGAVELTPEVLTTLETKLTEATTVAKLKTALLEFIENLRG